MKQRYRLEGKLNINPVPVLLGGLLRASENIGPGEVVAKRPHTYQFCVWQAEKLGIPILFPEHHPFMTVAPQRLLIQQNADWAMVERAFDYVWMEGKDPNLSCNEKGLVTECGRTSIFIKPQGNTDWLTPPISAGLLPGVLRAALLNDPQLNASEADLSIDDVSSADEIILSNALRGAIKAYF